MKYYEEDGKLYVQTQYNYNWLQAAKSLGGRWKADIKAHQFPLDIKEELENTLFDFFGYGGEFCTIDVQLPERSDLRTNKLEIGTRTILSRKGRDCFVVPGRDVSIIKGAFDSSGGSVKNPIIGNVSSDVVIRIRNIPKNHLSELDELDLKYVIKPVEGIVKSKYEEYSENQLNNMLLEIKEELDSRENV